MNTKKMALSPSQKPDRKPLERRTTLAETAIRISQVGTVFAPVGRQDRALEFYLDKLRVEKRADFPYGEGSRVDGYRRYPAEGILFWTASVDHRVTREIQAGDLVRVFAFSSNTSDMRPTLCG